MPSEKKEKAFSIKLPSDLHKKVKILSFESDISMADVCRKAIEEYIAKYKKHSNNDNKKMLDRQGSN